MRLLCFFYPCKWIHLFDVYNLGLEVFGVYQCRRCKTMSRGASRKNHQKAEIEAYSSEAMKSLCASCSNLENCGVPDYTEVQRCAHYKKKLQEKAN